MDSGLVLSLLIMTSFLLVAMAFLILFVRPWLRALLSGAHIALVQFVAMRLRGTPPMLIVETYVTLRKQGEDTSLANIEAMYLAHKHSIRRPADLLDLLRAYREEHSET